MSRRTLPCALAILAAAGCGAEERAQAPDAELERSLAEIRAATERYRDVEAALADGYLRDPMNLCVIAATEGHPPELGGMGIHYFRPDLLGITATEPRVEGVGTHTDFTSPGVLVYEPGADGGLDLVAVENLVFARAWREAGNPEPPSFFGREYVYLENDPASGVDEAHLFEPHYELHIWLYRDNPSGLFAPFNPEVSCEHHRGPTLLPPVTTTSSSSEPKPAGTRPAAGS